jgi:FkbM family methyltransferase
MQELIGQLYLRWAPRIAALSRTSRLGGFLRRWSSRVLPRDARIWVRVRSGAAEGLWLAVNPRTGQAISQGSCEPAVQRFLVAHVRHGMVVYDLGANLGFFSLLSARLAGPGGRVYSFEPDRGNADLLRSSAERNALTNVEVVEAAAWESSGWVAFASADSATTPDRGTGSVRTGRENSGDSRVAAIALDDFLGRAQAPNLIKCDVEGAEVAVFRGAARLLEASRPVIVCEVHSTENGRELSELLQARGYALHWLDANHFAAEARP